MKPSTSNLFPRNCSHNSKHRAAGSQAQAVETQGRKTHTWHTRGLCEGRPTPRPACCPLPEPDAPDTSAGCSPHHPVPSHPPPWASGTPSPLPLPSPAPGQLHTTARFYSAQVPSTCRPHSRLRPGPSPCALLPRFCLPDQTPGSLGAGPSQSHHRAAFEDSVDAATKLRGPNQAVQQGVGPSVNACVCTHTCPCAHIYTHTCVCSPVHVEWARPPAGTAVGQAAIVKQRAFCTPRRRAGGKTVRPVSCRTGSPALEAAVQGVQTTRLPDAGGAPDSASPQPGDPHSHAPSWKLPVMGLGAGRGAGLKLLSPPRQ